MIGGDLVYDYIILTAAITRPTLHREVFPRHLELLGGARVKWLINVDDVGTGYSTAETVAGLERMLAADHVDLEIFSRSSPCFLRAAEGLVGRAHDLLDRCRVGVVWLEDDWMPRRPTVLEAALGWLRLRLASNLAGRPIRRCPGTLAAKRIGLEQLEQTVPDGRWFVSMVPRSRVSFNPGIWSRTLFEQALWRPLCNRPANQPGNEPGQGLIDPETLCADPLNEPATYARLTVLVDPRFQDAGRQWSAELGVGKWSKASPVLQQCSAVTYAPRRPSCPLGPAALRPLCGWVEIPQRVLGMTLKLVGRIERRGGALTVRLVGVPYLHLELKAVAAGQAEIYLHRLQGWARTYPFKKLPGRVLWRVGERVALDVEEPGHGFSTSVTTTMPWRALWMVPLQFAAGLPLYLVSLAAALRWLDAERPRIAC